MSNIAVIRVILPFQICRLESILTHLCFTACFCFMLLESLHNYSILAFVVKKDGMLTKLQNVVVGWGTSLAIVLLVASVCYNDYGGTYHCWVQFDTTLIYGQLVPITAIFVITFTLIEAAGTTSDLRRLSGMDTKQYYSGKTYDQDMKKLRIYNITDLMCI